MKERKNTAIDLRSHLSGSIHIKHASFDKVVQHFKELLKVHGLKLKKERVTDESVYFEAIYGSRIRANLMALIPCVEDFLSRESRSNFGLKANIKNGDPIKLNMDIVRFEELFYSKDLFILSGSEDMSDEHFAVKNYLRSHKHCTTHMRLTIRRIQNNLTVMIFSRIHC